LAAGAFAAAIATAQGMVVNYDKALKDLNTTHSHLSGYLGTLQTEWNDVTAAVEKQGYATTDQQAKIDALAPAIAFLNAKLGENKTRAGRRHIGGGQSGDGDQQYDGRSE